MVSCAAFNCVNRSHRLSVYQKGKLKVSFHRFPKNEERRRVWIQFCRRKCWDPPKIAHLCSEHFAPECFNRASPSLIRLKPDAVPTVFTTLPEHLQQVQSTRRPSHKRYYKISDDTSIYSDLQREEAQILCKTWLDDSEQAVAAPADVQKIHVEAQKGEVDCNFESSTAVKLPTSYIDVQPDFSMYNKDTSEVLQLFEETVANVNNNEMSETLLSSKSPSKLPVFTNTLEKRMSENSTVADMTDMSVSKKCDTTDTPSRPILPRILKKNTPKMSFRRNCITTNTPQRSNFHRIVISSTPKRTLSKSAKGYTPNKSTCNSTPRRVLTKTFAQKTPIKKLLFTVKSPSSARAISNTPGKSPSKQYLLLRIKYLQESHRKKILCLQQANRRLKKKVAELSNVLSSLKSINCSNENIEVLSTIAGTNSELLKRMRNKAHHFQNTRKYSPLLRAFALTLHFYSPRAYGYVRKQFDSCLPHPKTISKWYTSVKGGPGFSNEILSSITEKVNSSRYKIYAGLMFDEMAIRQLVDGNDGYVEFGDIPYSQTQHVIAKEALVFMVVAINGSWKAPIAYFLLNGLNSEQKANLVNQALTFLHKTGLQVISLTCDALVTNFSMANILGCNLDWTNLKTYFLHPVSGERVYFFPDPSHMVKLARNSFASLRCLFAGNGERISWEYIEKLHILQQQEGLHLANKLRSSHVYFQKQKMKVKLATQLFSNSVADSLLFCKMKLGLQDFEGCNETCQFLKIVNDLFDILNSRRLSQYGFKKPLNADNKIQIREKLLDAKQYLLQLKNEKGEVMVNSAKKAGFLGFVICVESTLKLLEDLSTMELNYIPTYKLSQDHIEAFFSVVRSCGGYNNNPTCKQFKAIFKKLLLQNDIQAAASGNCISLENISVLHVSSHVSSQMSPEDVLNLPLSGTDNDDDDENDVLNAIDALIHDHTYFGDLQNITLSEFSKYVVCYIAGFVIKHLQVKVKCKQCLDCLTSDVAPFADLIILKDKGGLHYPAKEVFEICMAAEKKIRFSLRESGGNMMKKIFTTQYLTASIMMDFIREDRDIFPKVKEHDIEQEPLQAHSVYLLKAILLKYINIRLLYIAKNSVDKSASIRSMTNKSVLFRGQ